MDKEVIKQQISIDRVLAHFGITPDGNGRFRCPFFKNHINGDVHHSGRRFKGRVYCDSQKCFGEKGADIFGFVGWMLGDQTFRGQKKWIEQEFGLSSGFSQKIEILRVYKWTDEEGRTAYHLRMNDLEHKFKWNQKPDGTGAWTLKPCTPDLYQRHQVIGAQSVIVCAGERDCKTVNQWLNELRLLPELVATTPYSGESSVRADMLTLLHGKARVYVVGDNDSTGETYRKTICEFLQGKADQIYMLWVPELFNDISEWAERGATAADFTQLLERAEQLPENKGTNQEGERDRDPIETELHRLAALSELDYAKIRKSTSKRFDIGVQTLDRLVKANRRELGKEKSFQGQEISFDEILPADEPVDGALLLEKIKSLLVQFIILPDGAAIAISLWVLRAYAHDLFSVNPRLTFLSPERRCGKTTTLDVLSEIIPKPLLSSNVSPSSVFRVIQKAQPTLILDEMDSFYECDEALRGILNSGHTRTAARVIRNVGDENEPRSFSTWCPMVLAAIGKLPDTLMDRSIIVPMFRKKKSDQVTRWTQKTKTSQAFRAEVESIRRECSRWVQDHQEELLEADPKLLDALSDRGNDNWSGLWAIAELCGKEWLEKAQDAALKLAGKEPQSDTKGIELITDIRIIFTKRKIKHISSKDLCNGLAELEERPWSTWGKGNKPITQMQLATELRKFGISSRDLKMAEGSVKKGYPLEDFFDAWERYCSPLTENTDLKRYHATSCMDKREASGFQSATNELGSVSKDYFFASVGEESSGVAFQNGGRGGDDNKQGNGQSLFDIDMEEVAIDLDTEEVAIDRDT